MSIQIAFLGENVHSLLFMGKNVHTNGNFGWKCLYCGLKMRLNTNKMN